MSNKFSQLIPWERSVWKALRNARWYSGFMTIQNMIHCWRLPASQRQFFIPLCRIVYHLLWSSLSAWSNILTQESSCLNKTRNWETFHSIQPQEVDCYAYFWYWGGWNTYKVKKRPRSSLFLHSLPLDEKASRHFRLRVMHIKLRGCNS